MNGYDKQQGQGQGRGAGVCQALPVDGLRCAPDGAVLREDRRCGGLCRTAWHSHRGQARRAPEYRRCSRSGAARCRGEA
nr:MAG TPA: hypothetical protein [Caudoviricetes sp.]